MLSTSIYLIRPAFAADEPALRRLAYLADANPPTRPALLALIDGIPAAAIALDGDEIVADPAQDCGLLRIHLRVRAGATRAYAHRPELAARLRAALAGRRLDPLAQL